MSVSVSNIGSHSAYINYTIGDTESDVLDAISLFIATKGWLIWDSNAGANMRAYRVLNADGFSYKYITISLNSNYLYLMGYETWNKGTHAGTNICYMSDVSTWAQRYDLSVGASIFISASERYIVVQSISPILGSLTGAGACVIAEVSRENAEDTYSAGYPTLIWLNTYSLQTTQDPTFGPISFSRTRDGSTGQGASLYSQVSCSVGMGGCREDGITYEDLQDAIFSKSNSFNNKLPAFILQAMKIYSPVPGVDGYDQRGKIYGIKLVPNSIGSATPGVDIIHLKVNPSTYFLDNDYPEVEHFMLSAGAYRLAIPW